MHDALGDIPVDPMLTPELLLSAYAQGWFPMADPFTHEVNWYSPHPRAVFPLESFHVPRNLARLVRQRKFDIRSDTAFAEVMRECAKPRMYEAESWIDERIVEAYAKLHELGYAHSVEAWSGNALVGGLYGVVLGGAFFGESMFTRPELGGTNSSKVCLVHLVGMLRREGFRLLDTQFANEHLTQFGVQEISRQSYLARLARAVKLECHWGDVSIEPAQP